MDDAQIKQLEAQLENSLAQFSSSAETTIQDRSQILNATVRELIELHSNQIKNIGLISGVVAPLSLALLQAKDIDVNIIFLLLGFILLVTNIVLSQILLGQELNRKNRLMSKATLEYISASTSKLTMEDKKQQSSERTNLVYDFVKNIDEFDKLLAISPYSVEPMSTNARLRKYNRWTVAIFSFGCGLVVLSTFFNPLTQLLGDFLFRVF